jgi:stearoyl-CoA desaturase (delta-9 desaturase)
MELELDVARQPAKRPLNWTNTAFFLVTPVVAAAGAWLTLRDGGIRLSDQLCFWGMMLLSSVGVIAGYHRYYSHRTHQSHRALQAFYLLAAAGGFHQSALVWASEHRDHHKFVDTAKDPYNIRQGFFWAHLGWIFRGETRSSFDNIPDLNKDRLVLLQHRFYVPIAIAVGFGLPTLVGLAFGRPLAGLFWGGFLRLVIFQHCTFLVNSAAHTSGKQPYTTRETARDSWWLSFLTFGEGHHNFHHAFPGDYRIGHRWWHFDPAKWWIASMSALGLTTRLQRTPQDRIERAQERVTVESGLLEPRRLSQQLQRGERQGRGGGADGLFPVGSEA